MRQAALKRGSKKKKRKAFIGLVLMLFSIQILIPFNMVNAETSTIISNEVETVEISEKDLLLQPNTEEVEQKEQRNNPSKEKDNNEEEKGKPNSPSDEEDSNKSGEGNNLDWDKSSLTIISEAEGDCKGIRIIVQNGLDSEPMEGPSKYEVWKEGEPEPVYTGEIPALDTGKSTTLEYIPTSPGEYMFKVYQRPGHPGKSDERGLKSFITVDWTGCESPPPVLNPELTITLVNVNCEGATVTVENAANAGALEGPVQYHVYFSSDGDPKEVEVELKGEITTIQPGGSISFTFEPEKSGNYIVKIGNDWSNQVAVDTTGCENPPPILDPELTITLVNVNCEGATVTVENAENAGILEGPTQYQVYYSSEGDPKEGVIVLTGEIESVQPGDSLSFTFEPEESGKYIVKINDKWSNEVTVDTTGCENPPPPLDPELKITLNSEGCSDLTVTVKNADDAGLLEGPAEYKVYYSVEGDPKNGIVVASGVIQSIDPGGSVSFSIVPKESGNYIVLINGQWSNVETVDLIGCGGPDPEYPDLSFDSITNNGCLDGINVVVKNSTDAGAMEHPFMYEVYFAETNTDVTILSISEAELIASGELGPLGSGESISFVYKPTATGSYIFRIYQEGNLDFNEVWSDPFFVDYSNCIPNTPVDPEEPMEPEVPAQPPVKELPKTGETNPTLFYLSGFLLILLGTVLMSVSRFRKKQLSI